MDDLTKAVSEMGKSLTSWAGDSATTMTCSEVDSLALVLALGGAQDAAVDILRYHAEEDEHDDSHYLGDDHHESEGFNRNGEDADVVLYPFNNGDDALTIAEYINLVLVARFKKEGTL